MEMAVAVPLRWERLWWA